MYTWEVGLKGEKFSGSEKSIANIKAQDEGFLVFR